MFCPLCKAEYREGFTRCADCDVDLVTSLDAEHSVETSPVEPPGESFFLLWHGEDPATYTAILGALSSAQIEFREPLAQECKAPLLLGFPSDLEARFGFKVYVPYSDLEAARRILEAVLDKEPPDFAVESENGASAEEAGASVPEIPEEWNPEDATVEVWSSEDLQPAQFVADTFRENGLRFRILGGWPGRSHLLVHPQDEPRAREIIREVIEGTPLA